MYNNYNAIIETIYNMQEDDPSESALLQLYSYIDLINGADKLIFDEVMQVAFDSLEYFPIISLLLLDGVDTNRLLFDQNNQLLLVNSFIYNKYISEYLNILENFICRTIELGINLEYFDYQELLETYLNNKDGSQLIMSLYCESIINISQTITCLQKFYERGYESELSTKYFCYMLKETNLFDAENNTQVIDFTDLLLKNIFDYINQMLNNSNEYINKYFIKYIINILNEKLYLHLRFIAGQLSNYNLLDLVTYMIIDEYEIILTSEIFKNYLITLTTGLSIVVDGYEHDNTLKYEIPEYAYNSYLIDFVNDNLLCTNTIVSKNCFHVIAVLCDNTNDCKKLQLFSIQNIFCMYIIDYELFYEFFYVLLKLKTVNYEQIRNNLSKFVQVGEALEWDYKELEYMCLELGK